MAATASIKVAAILDCTTTTLADGLSFLNAHGISVAGLHNGFLYSNKLDFAHVITNEEGFIATVGYMPQHEIVRLVICRSCLLIYSYNARLTPPLSPILGGPGTLMVTL